MSDFILREWYEHSCMWHVIQLRRGDQSVELRVTEEELADAKFPHLLREDTMRRLAEAWFAKYGNVVIMREPQGEAQPWTAHDGDFIEGEVVEERRAIDAPRKAIKGR